MRPRRPWYVDMIHCRGMWAVWLWIVVIAMYRFIPTPFNIVIFFASAIWLMVEIVLAYPRPRR